MLAGENQICGFEVSVNDADTLIALFGSVPFHDLKMKVMQYLGASLNEINDIFFFGVFFNSLGQAASVGILGH